MTDRDDERSTIKLSPETPAPDAPSADETQSILDPPTDAPAPSEPVASSPETPSIAGPARAPSSLPLFGAAILAGAVLAVGGAFGLRHFDGSTAAIGALDGQIAALSGRTDSVESKADASVAALRSALGALESRVGAAERAASKATGEANAALSELQKTFAARLAALARAPESASDGAADMSAAPVDLGPLQARIDAIEQKLASLESTLSAPKADLRAQQEHESIATTQSARVQAVAIVAESLLRKLEHGAPFPTELTALDNLGVGQAELAPLRAAAGAGVASPSKLAEEFTGLASPILAAEAHDEDSLMDRLQREAANLVRVRRIGEAGAEATDIRAHVARIEAALKRLDIDEAYAAWAELPSAAKAKSEGWGDAAKARIDALNAARSIEADAVAALGKPKS